MSKNLKSHWECESKKCKGIISQAPRSDWVKRLRTSMINRPKCPICRGRMRWVEFPYARTVDRTWDEGFEVWRTCRGHRVQGNLDSIVCEICQGECVKMVEDDHYIEHRCSNCKHTSHTIKKRIA